MTANTAQQAPGHAISDASRQPQSLQDEIGDRQAGSQAWGFDPEEIDQAGNAMLRRPLNDKIRWRIAGTGKFGTNPAIGWHQAIRGKSRPVAADGAGKTCAATRIDAIVEF